MPIIQSAKKALRQNKKRNRANESKKNSLKRVIKDFKKLIAENKKEEALAMLKKVYKTADKITKTKYIKKNKASRIKSRTAKLLKKLK